jgi:hypothetical protein
LDDLKEARKYWKLKEALKIALFGELSLEEATDLSQDRLLPDLTCITDVAYGYFTLPN